MNQTHSRLAVLASTAIMAIVAGGCGSEEKAPSTAPPAELEETLGFSRSGIIERQSRVEGGIRDCMKAQGFDYIPVDPFAQQQALTGKARLTDEEFIKQFGYGISTLFGRATEQSDPNDRIRRSLGPADRAAYDRALYGETSGVTFAEAVDSGDFTELGGCTREATEEVFGGATTLTALQERLDELDERIVQDQRMVEAVEKWSACMREEGYRYEEPDEIDGDIEKRFRKVVGPDVRPGATAPADPNATYDRAALDVLQRNEVRTANADLACEKRHIAPVEEVVRPQYEEDFRRDHRDLLARVRPVSR